MPYISELLNNKIYDSSDSIVGKLQDILIRPKDGQFSPLEYLVVKTFPDSRLTFVPYEFVENFTGTNITLKNLFAKIALDQLPDTSFIYLKRDVLDQQIVDVGGTRVVRVNDLRIGNFDNRTCVLAIDPSFRGLLRRLGLEYGIFSSFYKVNLIDWRQAQLLGGSGTLQLNTMAEHLAQLHPADLANIVEELDVKKGSSLLASLDVSEAAKVLEEVDPTWQNILVKYLGPEKASKILAHMSSDEIVDLAKTFTTEESRKFLSEMQGGRAEHIAKLASYPDNTAGGLMTLEFVTVRSDWTVEQAIEEIKKKSSAYRSIVYVYVVDEQGKFYGVVSLRRLITAFAGQTIKHLAKRLSHASVLKAEDKMQKIIELMTRYNLYTAAVLDIDKKLVGVVTIDDVMRQLFPTA